MNRTEALRGAGAFTVPAALVIGGSMLTLTMAGAGHYRPEAAAPAPTVTAAPTARPAPVSSSTGPRPSASPAPASVVPVADRIAAMPHNASGGLSHRSGRPPSAPSPSPAAAPCSGQTLTVRVRDAACVTIGGGS